MKKKISILSFVAIIIALLTMSAGAITISEFSSKSTFKPVTYSTHKSVSSVTLYGNADYLCMKAYSQKNQSELFCLDIYSDSKYKKIVSRYSNTFKVGTKYDDILFDLTGFESGTYYAMAYVKKQPAISYYEGQLKKDPDTEVKFKIVINRKGSADIKNAKVFMYGYENTENGPTVYWYNLPKAKGYYIYRKDGDSYKKIATVKTNKGDFGKYTDKSYKGKNATKYYKIKAYSGSTVSDYSKNNIKAVIVKTPTVKAKAIYADRIKVSWSSVGVKNAEYTVFRAKGKNGEWEQIGVTTNRYIYDSKSSGGLKNNTAYYYTVIAKTSNTVSGYDVDGVGIRFFYETKLENTAATKDGVTVTWKKITGATSYEIYRRDDKNDDWVKIGASKSTSYTDKTIESENAYYYTVKAKKGNSIGSYNNKGICDGYFSAPAVNDITDLENGYPVITWSAVENCDKYVVYRRGAADGAEWRKIATTTELRYTDADNSLESGKQYYYTVKGVCVVDNSNSLYSDMNETGRAVTYYGILKNLIPAADEKGIALVWDNAAGVEKYNIYRKTDGQEFEHIGTSSAPNYTDLTAEKDVAYIYRVTYFIGDEEMTTYAGETTVQLKDNPIKLQDEGCYTVTNWHYYTVKIKDSDPFATYSFYLKTDDGMKLYCRSKTSDGSFMITHVPDVTEAEFVITAVKEDGTVYGFDGAESFKLYYPEIQSPVTKSNQTEGTIEISWPETEGADKYYVYKYDKLIATVENATSYVDTDIKEGVLCNYYVAVVIDYCLIKANYQVSGCIMKVPEVKGRIDEEIVKLNWDAVSPCEVLRRKEGETNWTKLTKTNDTFYYDSTVEDSQTYYYTVRPCHDIYGYGRYDNTGVRVCFMKPVKLSKLKVSGDKIIVEWPEKDAAESYELYRKAQGESKWSLIKTYAKDDKLRYEDTKIKNGIKYEYSAVAVNGDSKSTIVGEGVVYFTAVKLISAKATDKGITLKYENLGGQDNYVIYRKTGSGNWKLLVVLDSRVSTYTDKNVKSGTKYTYTVTQTRGTAEGPYDTKGVSAIAK